MHLDAGTYRKRVGMRAHFRLAPGQPQIQWVDIYVGRGFELYVTPLCGQELLVAALAHASAIHGPIDDQYRRWWNAMPGLAARLEGAEQISDLRTTSPLSGGAKRGFLPGCVLLGDAEGFTDPITGSGMTQALISAELLAQFAAKGHTNFDQWLPAFDRSRKALLRDCRCLADGVLWLADHPHCTTCVLAILSRQRRLFSHLLSVSGSARTLWGKELLSPGLYENH
jgi:flavin-dependent dehydrogenase